MGSSYSPGSINAGSFIGVLTASGTATNGTTVLGTVPTGKRWTVIAVQLTAEHDSLGTTATAYISAGTQTLINIPTQANTKPTSVMLTYPVGYGPQATAGQTLAVVSPNSDVVAYAVVSYVETAA